MKHCFWMFHFWSAAKSLNVVHAADCIRRYQDLPPGKLFQLFFHATILPFVDGTKFLRHFGRRNTQTPSQKAKIFKGGNALAAFHHGNELPRETWFPGQLPLRYKWLLSRPQHQFLEGLTKDIMVVSHGANFIYLREEKGQTTVTKFILFW